RHTWMYYEGKWRDREHGHRLQIFCFPVQIGGQSMGASIKGDIANQDLVAVGRSTSDAGISDIARSSGAILNDELIAEFITERRRQETCSDIGCTPGGKRHDHGYGSIGIILSR